MPQLEAKQNRIINYRPLFEFAVGLMLGIAVCGEISAYGMICIAIVCIIGIGTGLFIINSRRMVLLMFAILIGCSLIKFHTPIAIEPGDYFVTGVVESVGKSNKYGRREIVIVKVSISEKAYRGKICIQTYSKDKIDIGDTIQAYVIIKEYCTKEQKTENEAFDERKYYLSRGIDFSCTAKDFMIVDSGNLSFQRMRNGIRTSIENKAEELFGSDSDIAITLLIGNSEARMDERREQYQKVGISHILAISGFHMTVIVSMAERLLPKHRRWMSVSIIGILMLLYCILCVGSPGIIRASLMNFALLISSALERREDGLSAISLAVIMILFVNPYQLYSVSFQLSFAACFGILTLSKPLNRGIKQIGIPHELGLDVSVSASTATVMLQMGYFGTVSTYALLANLFAVPLFSIIIPLMIFVLILGYLLMPLASILAYIPRALLFVNDKLLAAIANMPYASLNFSAPPALVNIVFMIGLFIASDYVLRPAHKKAKYIFLIALLSMVGMILDMV